MAIKRKTIRKIAAHNVQQQKSKGVKPVVGNVEISRFRHQARKMRMEERIISWRSPIARLRGQSPSSPSFCLLFHFTLWVPCGAIFFILFNQWTIMGQVHTFSIIYPSLFLLLCRDLIGNCSKQSINKRRNKGCQWV